MLLVCWSSTGIQHWNKTIVADGSDFFTGLGSQTEGPLLFIYACALLQSSAPRRACLMKFDILGNQIWNVTSPSSNKPSLVVGGNDGVYMGVYTNLTRWSSSGALIWSKTARHLIGSVLKIGSRIITTSYFYTAPSVMCWDSAGTALWNRIWLCGRLLSFEDQIWGIPELEDCMVMPTYPVHSYSGSDGKDTIYMGTVPYNGSFVDLVILQWDLTEIPRTVQAPLLSIPVLLLVFLVFAILSIALLSHILVQVKGGTTSPPK
jgi:hypothetical protein